MRDAVERKSKLHFHRAIAIHGEHAWLHSVLATCETIDEANDKERLWVQELQTNSSGYNMTSGGDGAPGLKHSDESKRLLSQKQSDAWKDPDVKKKRIEAIKLAYADPILREKQRHCADHEKLVAAGRKAPHYFDREKHRLAMSSAEVRKKISDGVKAARARKK